MAKSNHPKLIEVELLPMSPEKNNPRTINENSPGFKELVESIAAQGVIVPVHVRTTGGPAGSYELLAGERRYWAAKKAGLQVIPAIDHGEISDADAFEITFAENFLREDLTVLEHGRAVALLLEKYNNDFMAVAAKLGKSESWVRLHHCIEANLIDDWKKAISLGGDYEILTTAHIVLIARFPAEMQERIRRELDRRYAWDDKKITVKDLERQVADLLRLLSKAPFDLAGCEGCIKRTSVQPSLWIDESAQAISKDDRCLDPDCWAKKELAGEKQKIKELREKYPDLAAISTDSYSNAGEAKQTKSIYGKYLHTGDYKTCKKTDKGAVPAVIVNGKGRGKIQYITITARPAAKQNKPKKQTAKDREVQSETRRFAAAARRMMENITARPIDDILADDGAVKIIWLESLFGGGSIWGKDKEDLLDAFEANPIHPVKLPAEALVDEIWENIDCSIEQLTARRDGQSDAYLRRDIEFVAALFGFDLAKEAAMIRICRECGCTEDKACPDDGTGKPCHWVEDDLCSACQAKAATPAKKTKGRGKNAKSKRAKKAG